MSPIDLMVIVSVLMFFLAMIGYCISAPANAMPTRPPLYPPTVPPRDADAKEGGLAKSQPAPDTFAGSCDTYRVATNAHGEQPLPPGTYLGWPAPTLLVLLVLGLFGAGAGSGGTPDGFAVAWLLNPINWGMVYVFFQIGKLKCPHCRRTARLGEARDAPVASPLVCPHCSNALAKPRG